MEPDDAVEVRLAGRRPREAADAAQLVGRVGIRRKPAFEIPGEAKRDHGPAAAVATFFAISPMFSLTNASRRAVGRARREFRGSCDLGGKPFREDRPARGGVVRQAQAMRDLERRPALRPDEPPSGKRVNISAMGRISMLIDVRNRFAQRRLLARALPTVCVVCMSISSTIS